MKFLCITKKERKRNICKRLSCNNRREHLEIQFDYGRNFLTMYETFFNKGIIEKLTREGKSLAYYTIVNKAETLNKP